MLYKSENALCTVIVTLRIGLSHRVARHRTYQPAIHVNTSYISIPSLLHSILQRGVAQLQLGVYKSQGWQH